VSAARVITVAILANGGIAAAKFVVAALSGSASIFAEGIHSVVDTGNELLLMLGNRRAEQPPDRSHPFGYGKVLYFWALIVALSMFSVGGGFAIYRGIVHVLDPQPLEDPKWSYAVLAIAAAFELYSWWVSARELRARHGASRSLWQLVRVSKDPSVFTIFVEDSAALAGLVIAFAGVALSQWTGDPRIDPAASILIGVLLVAASLVLARETGALLVGESMDRRELEALRALIADDPDVESLGQLLTMQLGASDALVAVEIRFRRNLSIDGVDSAIARLETAARSRYPAIRRIFFRPAHDTAAT
jgi:cation diffusion facilitator family transporter